MDSIICLNVNGVYLQKSSALFLVMAKKIQIDFSLGKKWYAWSDGIHCFSLTNLSEMLFDNVGFTSVIIAA